MKLRLSLYAACAIGAAHAASAQPTRNVWLQAAKEYEGFVATGRVRYGAGAQWIERDVSGPAQCSNAFFGRDPAPGVIKLCQVWVPALLPPPPGNGTLMPPVNVSLIPAGHRGHAADRVSVGNPLPSRDQHGAQRTLCEFSHMNFDDAIVFPGRSGTSHLHAYFGNTGSNAKSTAESLRTTGNSTCRGGTANRSSYWVPALIDTREGRPVRPSELLVYYKPGWNRIPHSSLRSYPEGLRMIAGDPRNTRSWPPGYRLQVWGYSCGDTEDRNGRDSFSIPNCPLGSVLQMSINFPQCWDGVNVDSPDHKSHMAYPVGHEGGTCPASHPVALPLISYIVKYPVTEENAPTYWRLASDNYAGPAGYSAHGDWFNGWRKEIMDTFVEKCLRDPHDCSGGLGDGRDLF